MMGRSGSRLTDREDRGMGGGGSDLGTERLNRRDDHGCFGCGHLNPIGLRLDLRRTEDGAGVWACFTPGAEHEGFAGIAHGGIVTAVLDEVMGWAVFARGVWAVTAKLAVSFWAPVEVGQPTRATGWVFADRGRLLDVRVELRGEPHGPLLAEATATFARVPERRALAWQARYGSPVADEPANG